MSKLGPADFAPYRDQISLCECHLCRELAYEMSSVTDFDGSRHRAAAERLFLALTLGEHSRMTLRERAIQARGEKAERLALAHATGASPETIAAIERGYTTVKMSDFYAAGMGLGIGPRHQD